MRHSWRETQARKHAELACGPAGRLCGVVLHCLVRGGVAGSSQAPVKCAHNQPVVLHNSHIVCEPAGSNSNSPPAHPPEDMVMREVVRSMKMKRTMRTMRTTWKALLASAMCTPEWRSTSRMIWRGGV